MTPRDRSSAGRTTSAESAASTNSARYAQPRIAGLFYLLAISQAILLGVSSIFWASPEAPRVVQLAPLPGVSKDWADLPRPAYSGVLLVKRSVEELTTLSERIVAGQVTAVASRYTPDGANIETEVTLAVDQAIKGVAGPQLRFTLPGGSVGNATLMVGGIPNFLAREHVVVFLDDDSQFTLTGMWQGKYSLAGDQALQAETRTSIPISELSRRIGAALAGPVQINPAPGISHAEFVLSCDAWDTTNNTLPISHFVNPTNAGSGAPTGAAFVRLAYDALNAWQALPTSWIALQVAGTTTRNGQNHSDRNNDIAWGDLGNGSTLGVNFCSTVNNQRIDSDTIFDNTGTVWSTSAEAGKIDLRAVMEHEFGHGIGIGHSDQTCNGQASTPLMCPAVSSGVRKTILADDSNAAAALNSLSGAPPAAPVALAAAGGASSVSLNWLDPATTELAFEVQRVAKSCATAGESDFKAVLTASANAVNTVDNDYGGGLAAGSYCYRVKALGKGGDSGFSNTIGVTVGATAATPTHTSTATIPTATRTGTATIPTATLTPTATRTPELPGSEILTHLALIVR